jgi:hypothetical protein
MVRIDAAQLLTSAVLVSPSAAYVLKKNYSGTNFISGFNFRTVGSHITIIHFQEGSI